MQRGRSLRRLFVPAPLAAGAVAVGGVPGVIMGFVAALILLDRLLDRLMGVVGGGRLEADRRFRRLAHERRRARLERRLRRRPPSRDDLRYLAMDSGWAAEAHRETLGLRTIAVDSIVGTVDAHKAATFDDGFRPPGWSRGRWTLMYLAVSRGTALPPISVYRAAGEHFVRDGHHRVSVARALGAVGIDAYVVDLS